jgi:TonB family protein
VRFRQGCADRVTFAICLAASQSYHDLRVAGNDDGAAKVPWISVISDNRGHIDGRTRPPGFADEHLSGAIPIPEADQHLIERKSQTYPPLAKAARVEGTVRLKLLVNSNGVVTQVLEPSGHPLLVRAATEAAQQYRYRPFEGGVPTTVLVEASVSFSLIRESASPSIPFPEVTDLDSVLIEYGDGSISLLIRANGLVEYDGVSGVTVAGKHQRHIEP